MVSPVSNSGVSPLQRPQQTTTVNQTANRQVAQAVLNRTPTVSKPDKTINLASANTQPQSNLPRGSIVDKLV
jgi:hypothetical protein